MSRSRTLRLAALSSVALGLAAAAAAEPMFLSRQYTSCLTCHYSATGGGLLTPYGRSLSAQELSTWGAVSEAEAAHRREEKAFWGVLGDSTGPVEVGMELRPAHLRLDIGGRISSDDLLMSADLLAAWRAHGYTVYGEVGREPLSSGTRYASTEHWVAKQWESGLGVRVGRFLPAYGINLADHTALTRAPAGFDIYDQVYAVEVSRAAAHSLWQVSAGPGRAESLVHDDGTRAFSAAGRYQWDLGSRRVLVASALYRGAGRSSPRTGGGGLTLGIAPTSHLSVWTEGDVQFQQGVPGAPAYTVLNETSWEVYRGLWLKLSPQLRTAFGDTSGGVLRLLVEADLLPRTHWNVGASYYRDKSRLNDFVTHILLVQLHLYL